MYMYVSSGMLLLTCKCFRLNTGGTWEYVIGVGWGHTSVLLECCTCKCVVGVLWGQENVLLECCGDMQVCYNGVL